MAELGIASSAIGVVSLGLQVCHGLLKYYRAWEDYAEDISNTCKKVINIEASLELLSTALNSRTLSAGQLNRIAASLSECKDGLYSLSKRQEKLKRFEDPQGFRDNLRAGRRHLLYPFRRDTLKKLEATAEDLVRHLKLALEVIQLDISLRSDEKLADTAKTSDAIQSGITLLAGKADDVKTGTTANAAALQHVLAAQDTEGLKSIDRHDALTKQLSRVELAAEEVKAGATKSAKTVQSLLVSHTIADLHSLRQWLCAPNAFINHREACRHREHGTGQWFLESKDYIAWMARSIRMLCLTGKPGCCKTVLCSTIIEDMQLRCEGNDGLAVCFFYFTFSDHRKQSYRALLLAIMHQLSTYGSVFGRLNHVRVRNDDLRDAAMEDFIRELAGNVERIYLVLDALDEIPEANSEREDVLEGILGLLSSIPKISVLTTSRPDPEVRETLRLSGGVIVPLRSASINRDIVIYVNTELNRNRKLARIPAESKCTITDRLSNNADGMFRWVYCQLQELSKLKILTPKFITQKLSALPSTLDETYERILTGIDDDYYQHAVTALRWLTFAERPLTLEELEEACITSHLNSPYVDEDNRAEPGSILGVISSLVTVKLAHDDPSDMGDGRMIDLVSLETDELRTENSGTDVAYGLDESHLSNGRGDAIVQLAHISVKDYLVSTRIPNGRAARFAMDFELSHSSMAQDCIAYLLHHHNQSRHSTYDDESEEPAFLYMASDYWYEHQRKAELASKASTRTGLEIDILRPGGLRQAWFATSPLLQDQCDIGLDEANERSGLYTSLLVSVCP